MAKSLDQTWEDAKQALRYEFDRLWKENSDLREQVELAQKELRDAARQKAIHLDRCPKCGYSEVAS